MILKDDGFPKTEDAEIEHLEFDKENPRLPSYIDREQKTIFKFLAETASINELASSIGQQGFFSGEPLIGVYTGGEENVCVVEGNRRLAALKLLSGDKFENMSKGLSNLVEEAHHKPTKVPIAIYENRNDVLNYLGNKHIAGVKPWGSLAKARYIKQLFEMSYGSKNSQKRVKIVAKSIGTRSDMIRKSLQGLEIYECAEEKDFFNLEGVDETRVKFSILTTALGYKEFQDFVYESSQKDFLNRKLKENELKELFKWLFQCQDNGKTMLGESRNLKKLAYVIASDEGLKKFRNGLTLEQAFALTNGINAQYDSVATEIKSRLQTANSIVADVDKTNVRLEDARSILRQAERLSSTFE